MTYVLIFSVLVILLGMSLLFDGTREDKRNNRYVEFTDHRFVGSREAGTCLVWSLDGTEQCGLYSDDHAGREPLYPADEFHPYVPNKQAPGQCAMWLPVRGGTEQQCLMSKEMHDE